MSYIGQLPEIGAGIIGRAVTDTLYVSPEGSGTNGRTWASAYQKIQDALNAASTDSDKITLICISPHTTYYDINTTGDPTWTGNYILKGSHRNFTKIMNDHASATSIMKFTGKTALIDLNFNLGSGNCNGVTITHKGFRVYHCMFIGEDITGAATALELNGSSTIKHGKIKECDIIGDGSLMTGLKIDNVGCMEVKDLRIGYCAKGIHQINTGSDLNLFDLEYHM